MIDVGLVKRLRAWSGFVGHKNGDELVTEAADAIERLTLELWSARNPPEPGMPHIDLPERSPLRREVVELREQVRVLREALEGLVRHGPGKLFIDFAKKALAATEPKP